MSRDTPVSKTVSLRVSEWDSVDESARALGISRTEYIRKMLFPETSEGLDGFDNDVLERIGLMETELDRIRSIYGRKQDTYRNLKKEAADSLTEAAEEKQKKKVEYMESWKSYIEEHKNIIDREQLMADAQNPENFGFDDKSEMINSVLKIEDEMSKLWDV